MPKFLLISLIGLLTVGCGDSSESGASAGGSGGQGGSGGTGGTGGAPECSGTGKLTVNVETPSADVPGDIDVSGPDDYSSQHDASISLDDLSGGEYVVSAARVKVYPADERVGFVYAPEPAQSMACVGEQESAVVEVSYELEPGSHKLWFTSQNGEQLVGAVDGADLAASAEVTPSVAFQGSASLITHGAVAVDLDGNLWVTANDGQLTRRSAATLGASSTEDPEVILDISEACAGVIPCSAGGLAFDAEGNLWAGIRDQLVRIDRADLEASGVAEPAVTITGDEIDGVEALAFDAEGSLWVASANDDAILKYDASRLDADDSAPADVRITAMTPGPVLINLGQPTGLAFDEGGALWVGFWATNTLVQLEPADLEASAELTPAVQLDVGVTTLLEGIAFDEQGNLWAPATTGEIVGIASAELAAGGDTSAALTRLSNEGFGSVIDLAFNPPPSWSPIHRAP